MTDITTVTTQDELDEALAAGIIDLLIDRPDDATPLDIENKKVRLWDSSSAILWGNSSAILRDNSSAILRDNSSADLCDSSSADLRGNSRAELWDSSSAILRGNSSAILRGNSRAILWDSSSAILRGNSSAILRGNSSAILRDNSSADLRGNSRADLWDNSRANLRDNSRAILWGNSSADLCDSSSADLCDSSSAILWGNSSADLRDNSSAILRDNSSVILWDNSSADLKKFTVAWKKSVDTTITGTGHVIDMTAIDLSKREDWTKYTGALVDEDGQIHLYKAVDDNLESAYSHGEFTYEIGSTVQPRTWLKNNWCGNGIHLCPSPKHASDHFPDATRFLEVTCDADTFMPIDASKIKTAKAYVLREVDICGTPIKEDK